jgi:predicted AAA+ superfamily ATPase
MEQNNTHLAGEYFVAAELYRRGFSVGMTIGNAKAIDLFINKDNKTVSIQVKAIRNKKKHWLANYERQSI